MSKKSFEKVRLAYVETFKEILRSNYGLTPTEGVWGLDEILKKDSFISFFRFYHDLRRQNKINLKLILKKGLKQIHDKLYKSKNMYSKKDMVKFVNIELPVGVFIFGDHVINIVADEKLTAFDIKSKQNAERYKKFFNSVWKNN